MIISMILHISARHILLLSLALLITTPVWAMIPLDRGELRFRGQVIDMAPKWRWHIASPPQRWSVDMADAQHSAAGWRFDLGDKTPLPFLEGHLFRLAERGGHDMVPQITFSSGDTPLTVMQGAGNMDQRFSTSIPVRHPDSGETIGSLQFTVEQALGVALAGSPEGRVPLTLVRGSTVASPYPHALSTELGQRLRTLLAMNTGMQHGVGEMSGQAVEQWLLQDSDTTHIAAAYASQLSDFSLHFLGEARPEKWQAQLNVSVTVY
ncbi:fimbrial protein [Aeromonas salmonicida]|uniref:F4 family fimbrial subunit n=1 Tax=Aeromonas salmonicida TaxID=645 RepID=UPI002796A487|nr:fimbrial protein [Aeromonas salmonicida]MDQ1886571.1 fimbrial protein [Aeromonas salmonicida]